MAPQSPPSQRTTLVAVSSRALPQDQSPDPPVAQEEPAPRQHPDEGRKQEPRILDANVGRHGARPGTVSRAPDKGGAGDGVEAVLTIRARPIPKTVPRGSRAARTPRPRLEHHDLDAPSKSKNATTSAPHDAPSHRGDLVATPTEAPWPSTVPVLTSASSVRLFCHQLGSIVGSVVFCQLLFAVLFHVVADALRVVDVPHDYAETADTGLAQVPRRVRGGAGAGPRGGALDAAVVRELLLGRSGSRPSGWACPASARTSSPTGRDAGDVGGGARRTLPPPAGSRSTADDLGRISRRSSPPSGAGGYAPLGGARRTRSAWTGSWSRSK